MTRSLNTMRGVLTLLAVLAIVGGVVWRRAHSVPTPATSGPAVVTPSSAAAPGAPAAPLPTFGVAGRDIPPALTLLVDASTTDAQLEALINAFRTARANGTLATLVPPTTPSAANTPFGMVQIYVMSDPAYATDARLREFVHPKALTDTLSPFEEAFGQRVRAFYFYVAQGDHETGSLGYDENGYKYGTNYKKLFGR